MTTNTRPPALADVATELAEPFAGDDRIEDVYNALNALREALLDIATADPEWVAFIVGPLDEAEGNIERLRQSAAILVVIADQVAPF